MSSPKATAVDMNALKSHVRAAVITQKANACPMVARLAWHQAGTYDKSDGSGGSNGATMRFKPECDDDANAGLSIIRDMLHPVKVAHPELSRADLWGAASCAAIEFMGGPSIPYKFGRTDATSGAACPPIGRLPDASQGAQHLRDVFYRMGFNDQEIVALSGAHTLGSCHLARSGFDGPWTHNPLKFDNTYFTLLLNQEWVPRKWDGNPQFQDKATGRLMMLPTDMAIKTDPEFRKHAERYAASQEVFFKEFSAAFAKLLALGAPAKCQPSARAPRPSARDRASADFRDRCMHGNFEPAVKLFRSGDVDVHQVEATSGRTGLHKAAFWGHDHMFDFLLNECKMDINGVDYQGDTPLHDAARFGHASVVRKLLAAGARTDIVNKLGQDVLGTCAAYEKDDIAAIIKAHKPRSRL